MKQLTVLCSSDLIPRVRDALVGAGVEGFLFVPDAVGCKPGAAAPDGRPPQWASALFVVPVDETRAASVIAALERWAGQCDVEPCLRILVSALEAVY
jgi:hypothetical protein